MGEPAEPLRTGFVPRPARVPANAVLLALADAGAYQHVAKAGSRVWVAPVGPLMAQLYTLDGASFGPPVPRREAGLW